MSAFSALSAGLGTQPQHAARRAHGPEGGGGNAGARASTAARRASTFSSESRRLAACFSEAARKDAICSMRNLSLSASSTGPSGAGDGGATSTFAGTGCGGAAGGAAAGGGGGGSGSCSTGCGGWPALEAASGGVFGVVGGFCPGGLDPLTFLGAMMYDSQRVIRPQAYRAAARSDECERGLLGNFGSQGFDALFGQNLSLTSF